jgi:protease-4
VKKVKYSLIIFILGLSQAQSKSLFSKTRGIHLPLSSITLTRDASSLEINPSLLPFLNGLNLIYFHTEIPKDRQIIGKGDAVFLGSKVFGGLSFGVGLQFLRPPQVTYEPQRSKFSLGLGFKVKEAISIGFSYAWFFADRDPMLDELNTLDLGITLRPTSYLSFGLKVNDLLTPLYGTSPIERTWNIGMGIRPRKDDRFSLACELKVNEKEKKVSPSFYLEIEPYSGLVLRGGTELVPKEHSWDFNISAQIELNLSHLGLGYGSYFQKKSPSYSGSTFYVRASTEAYRSLYLIPKAVEIQLEEEVNLYELLTKLDLVANTKEIKAVVLTLSDINVGLGAIQQLRQRIAFLKRQGKLVICYLDSGSGKSYYLCTKASKIFLNPEGGLRIYGLRSYLVFFKKMLDRLGIQADFVQIGEYKSAPESLTREQSSSFAKEALNAVLDDLYETFTKDIAKDMDIPQQRVKEIIDQGPFLAKEALKYGLVHKLIYKDQLEKEIQGILKREVSLEENWSFKLKRSSTWAKPPQIALVSIEGHLVQGRGFDLPLLDSHTTGTDDIRRALKQAREDPNIRAVVLKIESSGGSSIASDIMWREVWLTRAKKPVIACLGDMAASGAYYVASAANKIFASPSTITGSIGIFYGKLEFSKLLKKAGINIETFTRGQRADMESYIRKYTKKERKILREKLVHFYKVFLKRVAKGRGMNLGEIEKVAKGRIWTGQQAQRHRLVDFMGGLSEAIEFARVKAGIDPETPFQIIELPPQEQGLLQQILRQTIQSPAKQRLKKILSTPWPYHPYEPLAICPYIFLPK